jgi:hypothetical protein
MFDKEELVQFDCDETYYYIVIENDDLSIFSEEEWNTLLKIHKIFRLKQLDLESMSDSSYSWMFNPINPMYEKNILYRQSVYFMDNELRYRFGIKFEDLEPLYDHKEKIRTTFKEVKNKFTKDRLRRWIVDNYKTIFKYYSEL